jgi:hypothetical protein
MRPRVQIFLLTKKKKKKKKSKGFRGSRPWTVWAVKDGIRHSITPEVKATLTTDTASALICSATCRENKK